MHSTMDSSRCGRRGVAEGWPPVRSYLLAGDEPCRSAEDSYLESGLVKHVFVTVSTPVLQL
jgi:hypothetical protein